jgi:hypothetical protein
VVAPVMILTDDFKAWDNSDFSKTIAAVVALRRLTKPDELPRRLRSCLVLRPDM